MTYQIFAIAMQMLAAAKAWAIARKAERELAGRHYDPISAPVRGPLLSLLTSGY